MSETTRTFIAIELSTNIIEALKSAQKTLKQIDCDIKWVKPEHMHLTLNFLGEIDPAQLEKVKTSIKDACTQTQPMNLELSNLQTFPKNKKAPRIIWAGLTGDTDSLIKFAGKLEDNLYTCGIKKEDRKFEPHLTLGRIRSQKNIKELMSAIEDYQIPQDIKQATECITLFKSTLTPSGPIYEILDKYSLSIPTS